MSVFTYQIGMLDPRCIDSWTESTPIPPSRTFTHCYGTPHDKLFTSNIGKLPICTRADVIKKLRVHYKLNGKYVFQSGLHSISKFKLFGFVTKLDETEMYNKLLFEDSTGVITMFLYKTDFANIAGELSTEHIRKAIVTGFVKLVGDELSSSTRIFDISEIQIFDETESLEALRCETKFLRLLAKDAKVLEKTPKNNVLSHWVCEDGGRYPSHSHWMHSGDRLCCDPAVQQTEFESHLNTLDQVLNRCYDIFLALFSKLESPFFSLTSLLQLPVVAQVTSQWFLLPACVNRAFRNQMLVADMCLERLHYDGAILFRLEKRGGVSLSTRPAKKARKTPFKPLANLKPLPPAQLTSDDKDEEKWEDAPPDCASIYYPAADQALRRDLLAYLKQVSSATPKIIYQDQPGFLKPVVNLDENSIWFLLRVLENESLVSKSGEYWSVVQY